MGRPLGGDHTKPPEADDLGAAARPRDRTDDPGSFAGEKPLEDGDAWKS
ncbi:hypothetical protein GWG54_03540 [Natronococcus sp. JC468]|nr:hypothetical protein [Natronococcus sp. JC468]NKE34903.1 hypothetical protein [Natronococcus sp. JC468]